jgi:hypothetical protein
MIGRRQTSILGVLCMALCAGLTPVWSAVESFSDQTAAAGIFHDNDIAGDVTTPVHYPGGAVGDFNRDGWPDIFLLGGGFADDRLYINDGDGTFTDRLAEWDDGSGTIDERHRGHAAAVGDYNDDGWLDIFITSGGSLAGGGERAGENRLYRNNGDGTFTNVAVAAGVNQSSATYMTSISPGFGDYDLDGDLDLMVATWGSGSDGNRLYRNNDDGTFTDVTDAAGIVQNAHGFVPRFADMNGDRYPELLLVADAFTSRYYVNNQNGTFTDQTVSSGTGLDTNGMGNTVGDFNRDGLADWYVTSIYRNNPINNHGNFLYVNQGNDVFTPLPEASGAKDGGWGWGCEAVDYNNDGFQDIMETNGIGAPEWVNEQSYLYRNNGDMTFTEVALSVGINHIYQGRAVMTLDHDRDGDMDIVITSYEDPVVLFQNDLSGTDINWIQINLDTSANDLLAPDGYGSRVVVTTGSVTQYYWMVGGNSFVGQSQLVAHFGLGSATTVDAVTVEWSDGSTTVMNDIAANQIMTIAAPAVVPGGPGEASQGDIPGDHMQAGYDAVSGNIDVTFTAACEASNHNIYYGDLSDVSTYGYSGAACFVGSTGSVSFDPGLDNAFFLIVGNDGAVEGSYGVDDAGFDRPEDTGTIACDLPQDLSGTCDLP